MIYLLFLQHFGCESITSKMGRNPSDTSIQDTAIEPSDEQTDEVQDMDQDGFTEESGDCNDDDPNIHPDVLEKCDEIDNDCDGLIDMEDFPIQSTIFFMDNDSDGFGDANVFLEECTPPEGYVEDSTDCDDSNINIHPQAEDIDGDLIDSDCDGTEEVFDLLLSDYIFFGERIYDKGGTHLSDGGDFNGDGIKDFISVSTESDLGGEDSGEIYLLTTTNSGLSNTLTYEHHIIGAGIHDGYRMQAMGIVDTNNGGMGDILATSPENDINGNNSGCIYLFYGEDVPTTLAQSPIKWEGAGFGEMAGWTLENVGDLNSDGFEDYASSAPKASAGNNPQAGEVYIFWGDDLTGGTVDDAGATLYGENAFDWAGYAVKPMGDLNGDGLEDLIIGAPRNDDNISDSGKVYVVGGATWGSFAQRNLALSSYKFLGEGNMDETGLTLNAAKDIDGDGLPEVLIGAPLMNNETGRVYLYFSSSLSGGTYQTSDADIIFDGESVGEQFGSVITSMHDANFDNVGDFWITAPYADINGEDNGRMSFFSGVQLIGRSQIMPQDATLTLVGQHGDMLGTSAMIMSDRTMDGLWEIVFSAPGYDQNWLDSGATFLLSGFPNQ